MSKIHNNYKCHTIDMCVGQLLYVELYNKKLGWDFSLVIQQIVWVKIAKLKICQIEFVFMVLSLIQITKCKTRQYIRTMRAILPNFNRKSFPAIVVQCSPLKSNLEIHEKYLKIWMSAQECKTLTTTRTHDSCIIEFKYRGFQLL